MPDFVIVPRAKLVDYICRVSAEGLSGRGTLDHREWVAANDLSDLYVLEPKIEEDHDGKV